MLSLRGMWCFLKSGQMGLVRRLERTSTELYRVCFLARAGELGLLQKLGTDGASLAETGLALEIGADRHPALEALLDLGVTLKELDLKNGRYRLKGFLAKALAKDTNDSWRAMASEVSGLHVACVAAAPGGESDARRLAEMTAAFSSVIARSSRTLEPVLTAVTRELVPGNGPFRLLEVGCGSGVYVAAALRRNPKATAVAVERVPEVAEKAAASLREEGFADRFRMVNDDVRELSFDREFDLITLHNNIYYFLEAERPDLLVRLRSWLKPGGRLAVTTVCQGGGGPFSRVLMLWSTVTADAGSLPSPDGFAKMLTQAGFAGVRTQPLFPGEAYTLFTGENPA
ncbi:class I SAM-dependent methyltransferase [Desulfolutivibrio sp.]|uniref:class I SAM-dependent methyltransferase n=1 Tax=Desulfolutivibrio sp. TaxID=2773296 RepID=UPI002F969835